MLDEIDYKLMNSKSYKDQKKLDDEMVNFKVKCQCGHTNTLTFCDKKICSYCGKYVFKTPQIEFEYRLKEKMKK